MTANAQFAAVEAFTNGRDDGVKMREIYRIRRDLLHQGLTEAGIESVKPSGAFYIFAKIPDRFGDDDFSFCRRLATEAKVGSVPGSAFGKAGRSYFRLSYATSEDNLKEAIRRIKKFVGEN